MCRQFSESYRYALAFLLLVSLPNQVSSSTTAVTCPYDIDYSLSIIPPACYANATSASGATNCCWFVFASYLYAAIRYSNLTGAAFLPNSTSSACSSAFSYTLLHRGLVSPSLLLSGNRCDLSGDPVKFSAGSRPCQFATVSAIWSSVDLSDAVRLCNSGRRLLTDDQPACVTCQNAVIAATFALFDATQSKEIVACGMAATIGIWSSSVPDIWRFRSYALCMVQILENVGSLGTSNLLPSPPPGILTVTGSQRPSARRVKLAAGSASAVVVSFAAVLCLALGIRKWRRKSIAAVTTGQDLTAVIGSQLPTEGLYIFTKNELKLATNCYDQSLLLGEGGAGRVYLGKLPSGQHVAIKRIQKKKKLCEFYREVEILAKLRHRNLTTLVGYCIQAKDHVLVYEYMAGGDLSHALYHGELTWHQRVRIAVDIAEGLAYLHEFPDGAVVHRDVKPTNVLLSEAGQAKLSDFGVSKIVPSGISHVSTELKGTRGYMDPECFSAGHVSEAADVYGFGVVLLELVTGMRAVMPTPSGGAESLVQAAHGVMTRGGETDAAVGMVVDRRLAGEWDRGSAVEVFRLAYRCVKPYKNERPLMREVLGVLKRVLADIDASSVLAPSDGGGDDDVEEGVSNRNSAPSTSRESTPSIHPLS